MAEAQETGGQSALARFEEALAEETQTLTGVGLDVPRWLLRLEQEVHHVHAARSPVREQLEKRLHVPAVRLTFSEIEAQVEDWQIGCRGETGLGD